MVPGTAMGIRVRLAEDRADLIAYLRAEGAKPPP
jgi:cytochrome c2